MWPGALVTAVFAVASFLRRLLGPAPGQVRAWQDAVTAAGLTRVEETGGSLSGWKGGLHVRLTRYSRGKEYGTRVAILALASTLTLRPEGTTKRAVAARGQQLTLDEDHARRSSPAGSASEHPARANEDE
jgi:hypothetical protein